MLNLKRQKRLCLVQVYSHLFIFTLKTFYARAYAFTGTFVKFATNEGHYDESIPAHKAERARNIFMEQLSMRHALDSIK